MKVIFLSDVRGVGKKGDVKDVSDGYASNFLLPRKLAEAATVTSLAKVEAAQKAKEVEIAKQEEAIDRILDMVRGAEIKLQMQATPTGGLFKKVSIADIVKAIRMEKSVEVPENCIILDEQFKTTGEHVVHLKSKNKKTEIKLIISAK